MNNLVVLDMNCDAVVAALWEREGLTVMCTNVDVEDASVHVDGGVEQPLRLVYTTGLSLHRALEEAGG